MQKYKKAALNIAFLTFLLTGGMTSGFFAAEIDGQRNDVLNQEERLLSAFENDDYESWKKIVSKKSNIHNVVEKNDFETFVEARKSARSGDYEKAIELTEKLEVELKEKLSGIFS